MLRLNKIKGGKIGCGGKIIKETVTERGMCKKRKEKREICGMEEREGRLGREWKKIGTFIND